MLTACGAAAQSTVPAVAVQSAEQRLAASLHRAARQIMASAALSLDTMDASIVLIEQAIELQPNDETLWRSCLALADLAERPALQERALARLSDLAPFDEVVRLRRLSGAVEQFPTAEQRIGAYLKLLLPENQERIGRTVASRLARDLAYLYERVGDSEQMSHWLSESIRLDSANRSAVAFATGYFRQRVTEPFGEAELLVALLMADPADVSTLQALGQLLLAHGANREAVRLLDLAMQHDSESGRIPSDGLVADFAMALWAADRPDDAVVVLNRHQEALDSAFRYHKRIEEPEITREELMALQAPLPPTLGVIRTALLKAQESAQADASLSAVLDSYSRQAEGLTAADKDTLVPLLLEAAWTGLIFGGEPGSLEKAFRDADAMIPLTDEARSRFEGLIALRRGEVDRAVELLTPLADSDSSAKIGLVLAWQQQGRESDAGRALAELARDEQGTLVGVWAADRLNRMVGQRPGPRDAQLAAKLSSLIASIPPIVDRFAHDASLAVAVRASPTKPVFEPFEPVIVNVEITNNSPLPLAVDRDGPIQPLVAIVPTVRVSGVPEIGQLAPIIVDVGRKLRLEPRERLVVPVDLRQTHVGLVLDAIPLRGATVILRTTSNFQLASAQVVVPESLGLQVEGAPFRVDGENVAPEWLRAQIAKIAPEGSGGVDDADDPEEAHAPVSDEPPAEAPAGPPLRDEALVPLALVLRVVTDGAPATWPAEEQALLPTAASAAEAAFDRATPASQAWVMSILPNTPASQAIFDLARTNQDRLVRMAYLVYRVSEVDDPMLEAAMRGEDPVLRRLAELLEAALAGTEEKAPGNPGPTSGQ
jgi:tetratricopeptide (TPR) repeat protein